MNITTRMIIHSSIKSQILARYLSWPICFLVVVFSISYPNFLVRGQSPIPQNNVEKSEIENLSLSPASSDRYRAAFLIQSSTILDTAWAVETMVNGMQIELANPSSSKMRPGSYATNSERVLQKYVEALVHFGPSITASLQARKDTLSGDMKNWIIISLGCLKDESVHEELKDIFLTNPDLFTRLMSIRALGTYADTTDIPVFLEAYSDTSRVTMTMDHDVPGGDFKEDIFPLVGAALHALGKMGYTIEDDGQNINLKRLEE
jgi:hypothetical protein